MSRRAIVLWSCVTASLLTVAAALALRTSAGSTPADVKPLLPVIRRFEERHNTTRSQRMFCEVRYLGRFRRTPNVLVDVWEYCLAYARRNDRLVEGEGWAGPAAVTVRGRRVVRDILPPAYNVPGFAQLFPSSSVRSRIYALDAAGRAAVWARIRARARRALFRR